MNGCVTIPGNTQKVTMVKLHFVRLFQLPCGGEGKRERVPLPFVEILKDSPWSSCIMYGYFSRHVVANAFTICGNTQRFTIAKLHYSGAAKSDFSHLIASFFCLPSDQPTLKHLLYSCYAAYHVFETNIPSAYGNSKTAEAP